MRATNSARSRYSPGSGLSDLARFADASDELRLVFGTGCDSLANLCRGISTGAKDSSSICAGWGRAHFCYERDERWGNTSRRSTSENGADYLRSSTIRLSVKTRYRGIPENAGVGCGRGVLDYCGSQLRRRAVTAWRRLAMVKGLGKTGTAAKSNEYFSASARFPVISRKRGASFG